MNKQAIESLYNLLPAIYRQGDAVEGKPLQALLALIEDELHIIEANIKGLYEDWFIETCDEWVVPYIGDLVGAKLLRSIEKETIGQKATISQRAYVANTIMYRRRKGTAAVLEQIAHDVTGWDARVVEFFQLLSTTQHITHLRHANIRTPDLRNIEKLESLDTPFDTIPHTVDVRSIRKGRGYHNIPNIGTFLWRLQPYPVKRAPAFEHSQGEYSFSQLGYDTPLFNHPITETSITNLAEVINVPTPIRRLALKNNLKDYYGDGKSILVEVDGSPVVPDDIVVCDLSEWKHRPPKGKVAVDPVLGRIALPLNQDPTVCVTYYYGFSSDVGGGFYPRQPYFTLPSNIKTYQISKSSAAPYQAIAPAIKQWNDDDRPHAILEILDSEFYEETFELELPKQCTLVIRSAQEQRPVLRAITDSDRQLIRISGDEGSSLVLEGLLIDKSIGVKIMPGELSSLTINHCTLVPGENPSIELEAENNSLAVALCRTITGGIVMKESEAKLTLIDSIVDGKAEKPHNSNPDDVAIVCYETRIENTTIFGKVSVNLIKLASNTIFTDVVAADRCQEGCVRFSYVPNGSKVPRRYRCQPADLHGSSTRRVTNVYPSFTSEKYGEPGYAQLRGDIEKEIFEGADNEAEMGAFNHLYQSQRIDNLRTCYTEYLPFGLEAGTFLIT